MDLDFFKQELEKEETRIRGEIEFNEKEDPYQKADRATEVMDDTITEIEEHDRLQAILGRLEKELSEVKKAKQRIEAGTYGICTNCGEKITEERLKIMPTATLCTSCQEQKKEA